MFWAHKTWIFEFLDVSYIIDAIHIHKFGIVTNCYKFGIVTKILQILARRRRNFWNMARRSVVYIITNLLLAFYYIYLLLMKLWAIGIY